MHHLIFRAAAAALLACLATATTQAQSIPDPWSATPRVRLVTADWEVDVGLSDGAARYAASDGALRVRGKVGIDDLRVLRLAYQVASVREQTQPATQLFVYHQGASQALYLDTTRWRVKRLVMALEEQAAKLPAPPTRAKRAALSLSDVTPGGLHTIDFDGRRVSSSYEYQGTSYPLPTYATTFGERWTLRRRLWHLRLGGASAPQPFLPPMGGLRGVELQLTDATRTFTYPAANLQALPAGTEGLVEALQRVRRRVFGPAEQMLTGRVASGTVVVSGFTVMTAPPLSAQLAQLEGKQVTLHALVQDGEWAIGIALQQVTTSLGTPTGTPPSSPEKPATGITGVLGG